MARRYPTEVLLSNEGTGRPRSDKAQPPTGREEQLGVVSKMTSGHPDGRLTAHGKLDNARDSPEVEHQSWRRQDVFQPANRRRSAEGFSGGGVTTPFVGESDPSVVAA